MSVVTKPVSPEKQGREEMIGTVLSNRYKVIAELGSGGMAWVYLVEDLVKGEKTAVKVLYPQHSQDLAFLQRFAREAKLSMALSQASPQPNIVPVLDYGADRDTHYLVMEYVPGQDLGRILAHEGPLPWRRALDITRQVALALEHAEQLDIVHRDVKPSNIMVQPDGVVRVLDFGIARARTSPSLTLSGFVGSPHYAAPEQATGQPVDIRSDLYSLGVVLYRMLSGNLPFQGDTPWAVVNQHIVSEPPPLAQSHPDLPQEIIALVQKAMAKRPQDRFQSPGEMVGAIDSILASSGPPAELMPATATQTAQRLEALYVHAHQAADAEAWQEAVDVYSQILKIDPDFRDVPGQLDEVGRQIALANLYRSALRALHSSQWDQALAHLDRIAEVEPAYKDIEELRLMAERREGPPPEEASPLAEFPTQVPVAEAVSSGSLAAAPTSTTAPARATPAQPASDAPWRRRGLLWGALALLALIVVTAVLLSGSARREPSSTPQADAMASPALTPQPAPTVSALPTEPPPTAAAPTRTSPDGGTRMTPTPTRSSPTSTALVPTVTARDTPSPEPTPTTTPTTTSSPTALAPIFTPTSEPPQGQIAFPRFDPVRGTYDVYTCGVDGSGCRLIALEASQPDFLPDGSQLVAHSWQNDAKGLMLLTNSGQLIWRITDQIEAARPSADFLGDSYVYHSRQESDRQPRLYRTYGTDNRPIRREASDIVGQSPAWLPDRRILYSGCWLNSCGILVMQADGTFPRQVVAGTAETDPEASPDGRQVAFMSRRDGNWEVYVVDLDGNNLRRLTGHPANDGLPTWSPDGQYIAFVTDREGPWAVWVMGPDGSEQRRLFDLGGPLDGRVRTAASHEAHGWVEERISWGP